jgi:hypothetical protein
MLSAGGRRLLLEHARGAGHKSLTHETANVAADERATGLVGRRYIGRLVHGDRAQRGFTSGELNQTLKSEPLVGRLKRYERGQAAGAAKVDHVMTGMGDSQYRKRLSASEIERAAHILRSAWENLPAAHRSLLEAIGASQWQVVNEPLGGAVDGFLRSAGHRTLPSLVQRKLDLAQGVWLQELQIVLIDIGHAKLSGIDRSTYEWFLARTVWHEWGHALSVARCSGEDLAAGPRLLDLAPAGVREGIRKAGYRSTDYTPELVAEIYALLMARRQRKASGRPSWLDDKIYNLVKRVTGWSD